MRQFEKILVVVDPRSETQPVLERARQIALVTKASLHLLALNPRYEKYSLRGLDTLIKPVQDREIELHIHETWHRNAIETINHVQQMEGCQLVMKNAREEGVLAQAFGKPEDWQLLRQSRVPVLLVKDGQPWRTHMPIIAAVNADREDIGHIQLNQAILEYAGYMVKAFNGELHLASACSTQMQAIQDHGDGLDSKQSYMNICRGYARDFHLNINHIHVKAGAAETVISKVVKKTGAELLVIGTHARKGISAMAIGNTAEQLITETAVDMLVLQPIHHMEPLETELGRVR
ncbi:Universal stress protein E [invertebrate metagenome]|uniref:Universal stress protein E n=1 Tax=invertebrate metagenome TaxID=1711999 RepID=A0A2H9TAG4_9ZZZZ